MEKILRDTFLFSMKGRDCSDSILNYSYDLLKVSKDLLDEDMD